MPEQRPETGSPHRLEQEGRSVEAPRRELTPEERQITLQWVAGIGALGAFGAAAFNLWFFSQTGAWQMLFAAVGEFLAVACLLPAWYLSHRGRYDLAGFLTLVAAFLAFGMPELVHGGVTLFLTPGGVLLLFLVGVLVLPGRRWVWLASCGLFGAFIWLVSVFEPLPRYDLEQLGAISDVFALTLVVFLLFAGVWSIFRAYRRILAIRVRLTVSFVVVTLLPVALILAALAFFGFRMAQQQTLSRLDPVVTLKEAEIINWLDNLVIDLDVTLAGEEVVSHLNTLVQEAEGSQAHQDASEALTGRLQQVLERTGRYEELSLISPAGEVLVSTNPAQVGTTQANQRYFREGLADLYVQPPYYSASNLRAFLFVARPVRDEQGATLGVLAGKASLERLDRLMAERTGLGATGETYLVGKNHTLLTPTRPGDVNVYVNSPGIVEAVDREANGSGFYVNYRGEPVVGAYHWLPDLRLGLVAEQARAEALGFVFRTLGIIAAIATAGILIAIVVSLFVTRSIARPLLSLTETTAQVAGGDLALTARVEREDEIGMLARTFNSMTAQLRNLIGGLEQRVADRTAELEQRSSYLGASAEVGRAASSILDPEDLARQVVELIRERFDLYYVGLFLVDRERRWAVLRAGTGAAGQAMLARRHRIPVGEGMVGWSVANNRWRVALEAEKDTVRLVTAELPDTRSEAALPLRSRGRVLGALTVQDRQPGAFDEEMMLALQTMADQVAVALDNARLFAESQEALEAERRAYGEISREAWARMVRSREVRGYRCDEQGVVSLANGTGPAVGSDGDGAAVVSVPVPVRSRVIGTLNFRKPQEGETWSSDEVEFLREMGEQLGLALESARLYQDTQRRAAREELTSELTARIRESLDLETVLQTAVAEMRQALDIDKVEVRLGRGGLANGVGALEDE